MRKYFAVAACLSCVGVGLVFAEKRLDGQPSEDPAANGSRKRFTIVYSIRSGPARELKSTLEEVYQDSDVRVVGDQINNLLILQVDEESREQVLDLLKQLDRPPRSVAVELHLLKSHGKDLGDVALERLSGPTEDVVKSIGELERSGRLFVANRMQLTAVENQKAMLQVGEQVAVATGVNFSQRGSRVNSYQNENVGTLISVQVRASHDGGITLDLSFEKSEVVEPDPKGDDADQFVPSSTATLVQQTTVQLRDGDSELIGNLVSRSPSKSEEAYLVVGARIVDTGPGQPVLFRSFSRRPTAAPPVRSSSPPARPKASSGSGRPEPSRDARASYVRAVLDRYDTNDDGVLTAEEWKQMSRSPSEADTNSDGKITSDEYLAWLSR